MSTRVRLSEADRRKAARIIGECCELGAEPHAWGLHLICELRNAIGFQLGTLGMSRAPFPASFTDGFLGIVDHGWTGAGQREQFQRYWREGYSATEPFVSAFTRDPWRVRVLRWQDACTRREWYESVHFNDFYRPSGLEHTMPGAAVPSGDSGVGLVFINLDSSPDSM